MADERVGRLVQLGPHPQLVAGIVVVVIARVGGPRQQTAAADDAGTVDVGGGGVVLVGGPREGGACGGGGGAEVEGAQGRADALARAVLHAHRQRLELEGRN